MAGRPQLRVVNNPDDPEQQGLHWLMDADDVVVSCRGQWHTWPKMKPGKTLPKGMRAVPYRDGCVELVSVCLDGCGTERRKITKPGGVFDDTARFVYTYDKDRYTSPKGAGLSKADAAGEAHRRNQEMIVAAAQSVLAQRPDEDEPASEEQVPKARAARKRTPVVPLPRFQTGG